MHTRELLRIQPRLHRAHGVAHEVVPSLDVNPHIVAVGAQPIDVALIEEEDAASVAQNDSPGVRIGQDARQRVPFCSSLRLSQTLPCPIDGNGKALAVDRLQEVVQRV